jgi:metal-sulfur cluster biosynthetic enzyme
MVKEEDVIAALRKVYDPEISINVYDLGLIYNLDIKGNHVHVKHTLTSMMCPFADQICQDITDAVKGVTGVGTMERELVWDPPFSIDMVPEETKFALGWDIY